MSSMVAIQCVDDAREAARRRLPRMIFEFVDGAAGDGNAMLLNRTTLDAVRLEPRVLVDVAERRLGRELLGRAYGLPFGIAPMGMCALAWPGADRILAAAAARRDIPLCYSTAASVSLEEGRRLAGANAWFQLYVGESHDAAFELVDRAENAGYEHLVFTVDTPELARRRRELRRGFKVPFRLGPAQLLDFVLHPRWSIATLAEGVPKFGNYARAPGSPAGSGPARRFERGQSRGGAGFEFLHRLRERWPGQLIVKGVLSPEDAVLIKRAGADAIYVSNHGGRQLDAAPPAICMLPLVREAVGPGYPLVFDSGVRCGEGIVKALALGADFVMLGRPFLYALGAGGEAGVARIVDILAEEVSLTLAQIGCPDAANVDGAVISGAAAGAAPVPASAGRDAGRDWRSWINLADVRAGARASRRRT